MRFLKGLGIWFLGIISAILIFAAVIGIMSLINGVGFYEQCRLLFGSASNVGKFLKGL